MMDFSFNEKDKQAVAEYSFGNDGNRISQVGAYVGVITQAFEVNSRSSESKGVQIDFRSFEGSEASVTLWTYSGKTKAPVDFQVMEIKALMAILGIDGLKSTPDTTIESYDYDLKKTI